MLFKAVKGTARHAGCAARYATVNWVTTTAGVIAAAGAVLVDHDNENISLAGKIGLAVGTFLVGGAARDANKSTAQTKGK